MKIAVLEDDRDYREVLTKMLEEAGYEVFSAATGFDMVNEMVNEPPDLILLDLQLPLINGEKVMGMFQQKEVLPAGKIPVIILSSKDEGEIKAAAQKLNAVQWFRKPVEKKDLLSAISRYSG
ncbi:MAG: response regulator [Elusimicrobiota bacterium]